MGFGTKFDTLQDERWVAVGDVKTAAVFGGLIMTWVRSARVDGFLRCILTISFLSLCVSCGGSASDTNDLGTSADMVGIDQAGSDTGRSCIPNCAFKQCGDDGCGGSCGVCGEGLSCTEEGYCAVNCIPDCAGRDCGDDGCGGSCGFCDLGTACSDAGVCTESCIPDCTGKHCGADGCGGSCGSCAEGLECDDQFRCVESCTPDCTDRTCGDDGCAGSCGDCAEGLECTDQGVCDVPCVPDCAGKQCGADGCGSFCGECLPGLVCDGAGLCEPAPPSPYGGPCHITADCQPFVVNPDTGGIAMNPAWPVCLNGQCADDGDQCLAPFGVPVCVRSCSVTKDDINNASGEAGPDLIDDPDVTGSVCEGADSTVFEGSWSCVNISDPGTIFGLCMPGEDFRPCDNSTDCSVDETCQVLSIAGTIEARCLPHIQDTAVNVVSLGEVCEVNVFTPAVFWAAEEAFCDTQLCIGSGVGCSAFCISDDDCLTAGASAC
ncbi:MAG: hypothetical protein CMH54_13820, partial [Myxococcales bacterium]|nr:hypothetical protein [Myxococcales bacterium]